jgi:hypothetical protein
MATRNKVQFVSSGTVFLGGTSQTSTDTGGLVQENFDGALTNVRKYFSPERNNNNTSRWDKNVFLESKNDVIKVRG